MSSACDAGPTLSARRTALAHREARAIARGGGRATEGRARIHETCPAIVSPPDQKIAPEGRVWRLVAQASVTTP